VSAAAPETLTATPARSPEQLAIERDHGGRGFFTSSEVDLDLAYPAGADLDGRFDATCLDTGDRLQVNGWLFVREPADGDAGSAVGAEAGASLKHEEASRSAIERGHTRRGLFVICGDTIELAVSPDADLDGEFPATCLETGQPVTAQGWMFESIEVGEQWHGR
jgi:hypothetical protein